MYPLDTWSDSRPVIEEEDEELVMVLVAARLGSESLWSAFMISSSSKQSERKESEDNKDELVDTQTDI